MVRTILLIGGHGKVAQHLTPLLLARSWNVISVIRTHEQTEAIEALGRNQPGKLSVLVRSVANIKSEQDAQEVISEVNPEWVVWSAGAGGKGGQSNTNAIDRDAAIAFTRASVNNVGVKKFLTVSFLSSRRGRPSWWTEQDWERAQKINNDVLPVYFRAKLAADEVLTVLAKERYEQEVRKGVPIHDQFCGVSLRPGTLTDEKAGGVHVGKLGVGGKTSRATTAHAILAALETQGARGWIDVIDGDENVKTAIERVVRDGVDTADEEDLKIMKSNVASL